MKTDKYYSQKILELARGEHTGKDCILVTDAMQAYVQRNYRKVDEILEKLSDDYQLLEKLIEKLKGKSTYTGLRQLLEGKDQSNEQAIISTSSLICHAAIEMKEHKEYKRLLPGLYKKLGVLINGNS